MMSQYKDYRRKAEQEARRTKKILIEDGVLYRSDIITRIRAMLSQSYIHHTNVMSIHTLILSLLVVQVWM